MPGRPPAFPRSTYVEVANTTHVTALIDFDTCTSLLVRRFVRTKQAGDTSCARDYHENRLVDRFARTAAQTGWGGPARRTARVAAATVADVLARWLTMVGHDGAGPRGGTFTTRGGGFAADDPVGRWRLDHVRWVDDVTVSGRMEWQRDTGLVTADVRVSGRGARPGHLHLTWRDTDRRAVARAPGRLRSAPVRLSFAAP